MFTKMGGCHPSKAGFLPVYESISLFFKQGLALQRKNGRNTAHLPSKLYDSIIQYRFRVERLGFKSYQKQIATHDMYILVQYMKNI